MFFPKLFWRAVGFKEIARHNKEQRHVESVDIMIYGRWQTDVTANHQDNTQPLQHIKFGLSGFLAFVSTLIVVMVRFLTLF